MRERETSLWTSLGQKAKLIIIGTIAAIILLTVLLIVVFAPKGRTTFDAEASLREIFEISNLSTVEHTYNGIAEARNDKEVKYHIYYEGKVKAGFDIEKVKIVKDGDTVTIIIPTITIHTVEIYEDSMDYIFTKTKYDTETTLAEAINICKEDLLNEILQSDAFINTAKESARDAILALTQPFLSEVAINIQFADEQQNDNILTEGAQ